MASASESLLINDAGREEILPLQDVNGNQVLSEERKNDEKLSTFMGVYVPCATSILGLVLFLRLGWVVGVSGLFETYGIITFSLIFALLTVLSISAISANGSVKGGGLYFMISRSLGVEFGGSIGLIFYFANVVSIALYLIGFADTLRSTLSITIGSLSDVWVNVIIATIGFAFLFVCALIGAAFFSKVGFFIWIILYAAVTLGIASFIFQKEDYVSGFTGFNSTTFHDNLYTHYPEGTENLGSTVNLALAFNMYFPAVTGIMAGANLCGDLKTPARSIPLGTLLALGIANVLYFIAATLMAGTVSYPKLISDTLILQDTALWKPLIVGGVCAANLAAGLSNTIGAARIMQALARDNIFPVFRIFAKGSGSSDEPRRAVFLTYILAQCVIFIGKLELISPITTYFFCLSYCVTNFACFLLRLTSAPNFRPRFHYFNWITALVGTLMGLVAMFYTNLLYAVVVIAIMAGVFFYIHFYSAPQQWGDVTQALIYHQVRKYLLRLDVRKEHVKFWRPQILLLVSDPRHSLNTIEFTNNIKKSGLFVLGNIVTGDFSANCVRLLKQQKTAFMNLISFMKIKAFDQIIISPSLRVGVQNLVMAAGLGALKPNTVVVSFRRDRPPADDPALASAPFGSTPSFLSRQDELLRQFSDSRAAYDLTKPEYVAILRDCVLFDTNLVITRNFDRMDRRFLNRYWEEKRGRKSSSDTDPLCVNDEQTPIDVWMKDDFEETLFSPSSSVALQLAFLLSKTTHYRKRTFIRVFVPLFDKMLMESEEAKVTEHLQAIRVEASVHVVHLAPAVYSGQHPVSMTRNERYHCFNALVREHSAAAAVVFTTVDAPPVVDDDAELSTSYLNDLDVLSEDLPPVAMVYGVQEVHTTQT
eukprot:GCRY01000633.1.p1 GENE.GCRY01000633.1~~GCRY01000633.1.p1  ORF type:complete len:876 (+),score=229.64 GCRY01000633.1:225-2852(+)